MISTLSTRRAILAAIVLLPYAVSAQANAEDPQNPQAATANAPYKSVFSDYKSYQDPAVQSWKKSNADVSEPDTMKDSGMGGSKSKSSTASEKKSASPSANLPHPMPHPMPDHNGMQKQ
jgi:hypothetical protein